MSKNKILTAAALSLSLLGATSCAGPGEEYNILISNKFSAAETDQIFFALNAWETAMSQFGLHFNAQITNIDKATVEEHGSFYFYPVSVFDLVKNYGGTINTETGMVRGVTGVTTLPYCMCSGTVQLSNDIMDERQTRMLIAHEIGHVLGLRHVPAGDLMYVSYENHGENQPPYISCEDVRQYAQVRNIDVYFCDGNVNVLPPGFVYQ
jgi:hypothetical protein